MAALLGEMRQLSGEVYANGAVAFVPQTAWIPNDTLRNNVCFGRPYDEQRYKEVCIPLLLTVYSSMCSLRFFSIQWCLYILRSVRCALAYM
jgi:hypothetical protein